MLLFIHSGESRFRKIHHFNTSHVTVYRYLDCCFFRISGISIHLMLLFITSARRTERGADTISIHLMLLFIGFVSFRYSASSNFNTSHVTVYQCGYFPQMDIFKNFNTSHVTVYQSQRIRKMLRILNFNTSHVTVYLQTDGDYITFSWHFNTSHVTVYPNTSSRILPIVAISIHLMLLFIGWVFCGRIFSIAFQYISCYCLSL